MASSVLFDELQDAAAKEGLSVLGVVDAGVLARHEARLREWQARGLAAGMEYMKYPPNRYLAPRLLLENCRSIVSFAAAYSTAPAPMRESGEGRVARYAWGKDYHLVLPERVKAMVKRLPLGESAFRVVTDAAPLLERALGESAGLGQFGKNTLLIRPGIGSFFFLAELLSELEIEGFPDSSAPRAICGSCGLCRSSCPTGALVHDFTLDAGRCISYLTIEKRGSLTPAERELLGEWLFGCDTCQEVCPFNSRALRRDDPSTIMDFTAGGGVGPLLDLGEVLRIRTNAEFDRRFAETPLLRARRAGLVRNACCVAANTYAFELIPVLEGTCRRDPSEVVRQHALWAWVTLERHKGELREAALKDIMSRALGDPSRMVQAEARSLLNEEDTA